MRIVGGRLGGRRFQPPARIPARPTTDLAREGLFNILNNLLDFEGIRALDLFAGTGSVAYELVSRGADKVTCLEADATSVGFMKSCADDWKIGAQLEIIRGDVFRFIERCSERFDFIFADPPYAIPRMDELPELILTKGLLEPDGLFVLEHDGRHNYEQHPHFVRAKAYGDTRFTFFAPTSAEPTL